MVMFYGFTPGIFSGGFSLKTLLMKACSWVARRRRLQALEYIDLLNTKSGTCRIPYLWAVDRRVFAGAEIWPAETNF
jgi:hypothetical protein